MHFVLSDTYESLRDMILSIPSTFSTSGVVIHDARNQIRVIRLPDGRLLNVKRFRRPSFINQLVYTFIRPSKAQRAYENGLRLQQLDIPTPPVVGYIENKTPLLQESYLITIHERLRHRFYELRYYPAQDYQDVIRQFAQLMARMHSLNILHLDLSPGNILFDRQADGQVIFSIVDINRIRYGKPISRKEACRNFCRLWGHMDVMEILSREYAAARGWDEQETRNLIIKYWEQFWHIRSQADIDALFDPALGRELLTNPLNDLD